MLLKSLSVQGFKTFPDKTKITFDKGITSIVGPNGSGKSNISDAIRWVLGEQSPKSIRCAKMEEIVFNGTDTRKKHGFAEVTLTIENKDRMLSFDDDTVAITRRFYRSGESEYLINKASVRLKDINELFMDTGLGRDGYSMISQGKIDSIVSSKGEDRREIFEEAAGISRYRYRKTDAQRKLAATEENLLRLKDIVSELEQRVEPLREQSEKAESFLKLSEEKKELEIALWLNTLENSAAVLRAQEEKIDIARAQRNEIENEIEDISKSTEKIYFENNELAAKADTLRRGVEQIALDISGKKNEISVCENDIFHCKEDIKRIEGEIEASANLSLDIEKETGKKAKRISDIESRISSLQDKHEKLAYKLSDINTLSGKSFDMLQEVSDRLTKLNDKAAEYKVLKMTTQADIERQNERVLLLNSLVSQKQVDLENITINLKDYRDMLSEANENMQKLSNMLSGNMLKLESRTKKKNELKEQLDKTTLDMNDRKRRVKALEDLERNLEGFNYSVKKVVKDSQRGLLKGIHGPVSRVIKVPSEYNIAIETALGAAMQNIVTGTEEDAKAAINYLKKNDGGRATFLPMTTIKGIYLNQPGLKDCDGFIDLAANLCACEDEYKGILSSLLGRVVIVDNLNHAVAIAKRFGYKFRIVTLDGQVVNAGGSLTGGSQGRKTGLLSRVSEIEKNKKLAIELQEKINAVSADYTNIINEVSKVEAEILGLQTERQKEQENIYRLEAECKTLTNDHQSLISVLSESKEEIKLCLENVETLTLKNNEASSLLEEIESNVLQAQEQSESLTANRQSYKEERDKLSESLQSTRMDISMYEKDIELLNAEIENARLSNEAHEQRKVDLLSQIEIKSKSISEKESKINELCTEIQEFENTVQRKNDEIEDIVQKRQMNEKLSADCRIKEKEKVADREKIAIEISRLEERIINFQKEYDEIISKLWEEYELTKSEAQREAAPVENKEKAQRKLNSVKADIRKLGTVNVSAIEEYKEVSERYEFLTAQVNDVEKSRDQILKLINDLTKQMKEIFSQRFSEINSNFSKTFKELFGGGEGTLELDDPQNILECGIDIKVHPPGKIVENIDALSGGEKALVAIALYFAIMKVSPAPFCVMDEIEAALDEVNVYRFASYLRRINENTQFILITHRRGTMEEADVLYGVTMQEKGVSKLLALHTTEVSEKLGIKI